MTRPEVDAGEGRSGMLSEVNLCWSKPPLQRLEGFTYQRYRLEVGCAREVGYRHRYVVVAVADESNPDGHTMHYKPLSIVLNFNGMRRPQLSGQSLTQVCNGGRRSLRGTSEYDFVRIVPPRLLRWRNCQNIPTSKQPRSSLHDSERPPKQHQPRRPRMRAAWPKRTTDTDHAD